VSKPASPGAAAAPRRTAKPAAPAALGADPAKEPPRMYWLPPGESLDAWSPELRTAVAGIVNPAYEELVLRARPGLQQSTGVTIVHLLWLEILDQIELGRETAPSAEEHAQREARALAIARHLRLVNSKLKATDLLDRLDVDKISWTPAPPTNSPGDVLAAGRPVL
jgi:hypothetical protein